MKPLQLPSGWYVICDKAELEAGSPNALRRFGRDWVVWRGPSQQWILQPDLCPHRSAKLSAGTVCEGKLRCRFHGWDFDEKGACVHVPEIGRDAPGVKLSTQVLREEHGFLWMWHGSEDSAAKSAPLPWFELLDSRYAYSQTRVNWPKHFSRCVENQLDFAHLPFVHANTIGRGFDSLKKRKFEGDAQYLRVTLDPEKPERTAYFEYRYPNLWHLYLGARMSQFIAFVPVDDNNTRIYLRAYQRFLTLPILRSVVNFFMKPANAYILRQDYSIVMTQEPGDVREAQSERLFPSDKAIQDFRRWLAGP